MTLFSAIRGWRQGERKGPRMSLDRRFERLIERWFTGRAILYSVVYAGRGADTLMRAVLWGRNRKLAATMPVTEYVKSYVGTNRISRG